jgi:hypothetical protein
MSQRVDLGVEIAAEYERDDLDSSLSPETQHDEAYTIPELTKGHPRIVECPICWGLTLRFDRFLPRLDSNVILDSSIPI